MAQVEEMAAAIDLDAHVIRTGSKDEMRDRLRELVAAGVERVAVGGGDGTIGLAVQEVAYTDTVLGILPMGTSNNFATALRLPQSLPQALQVLRDGEEAEVGLGKVCGRYFTETAGVGLFADILALYGAGTNKNMRKGMAAIARVILSLRARRLSLTLDGEQHVERAVMCVAANSFRMGLAFAIAPHAKLTDEELDVVVLGDLNRRELVSYYRAFRAQTHLRLPKVRSLRAREIHIDASRPLNVHCDDQVVGTTPVTITSHPGALKVLLERL